MRKLLILFMVSAFVLCGCGKQNTQTSNDSEPMYYIEHAQYGYYVYEDHTELKEFFGDLVDKVEIPEKFFDSERKIYLPLTVIRRAAFNKDSGTRYLVIPDSVTKICSGAFIDCIGLEEVTIGSGVKTIESSAFSGCWGIKSINIPDSVEHIGDMAFYQCASLEKIALGAGVKSIGTSAFSGCLSLADVTCASNISEIGGNAFEKTPWFDGLTEEFSCLGGALLKYNGSEKDVVIPQNVTAIADAFSGNKELASVKMGKNVSSICYKAFFECSELKSVEIPESVNFIGSLAFAGTPYYDTLEGDDGYCVVGDGVLLKYTGDGVSIKIPDNVKSISDAFRENKTLCDVRIGDNTHSIGEDAFFRCEALQMVIMSPKVSFIHQYAFDGCEITEFNTEGNQYAFKWAEENGISNVI